MKTLFFWVTDKIFWALFVVPALSAWLKDKEITPWISASFGWIYSRTVDLLGEPTFPWISGTLLGITIGVLFHRFFIWTVRTKSENKFDTLDSLSVDVLLHFHNSQGIRGAMNEDVSGLQAKVQRLFAALQKHRITTPNLSGKDGAATVKLYINYLRPFMKDRDIRILRQRAKEWVERL
jgi:hypothetical protein